MSDAARNVPEITPDTAAFWEGCREGRLLIQCCGACGHRQFYPRLVCSACGQLAPAWVEASGKGTVESFTVMRQAISPAYAADVPYVLAIIRLAEGPTMMSNVIGCDPDEVSIGMPVRVAFEPLTPEIALPKFRPA